MRVLLAAFLLLSAAGASAQPIPWPRAVADFASRAEIEHVAAAFPNSANMQRRRLAAALEAHDAPAALDALRRLAAGVIVGLGPVGYELALEAAIRALRSPSSR